MKKNPNSVHILQVIQSFRIDSPMLNLSLLKRLDYHQNFLQKRVQISDVFLVGWCIRDLLLWISKEPLDIDFTCEWNPEELDARINMQWLSHFKTDKFWTITLIPSKEKGLSYQLTPLRTEWNYEDFRHPWEINRSNDILLDAKRRDFSINAIYYFSILQTSKKSLDFQSDNPVQISDLDLVKTLQKEWYCYLSDLNLLILSDSQFISQVFPQSHFDEYAFRYLVETQNTCYHRNEFTQNEKVKKSENRFRVLIDPTGWIESLVSRKLTTVWNPDQRFGEDALRLVRWIRLVNVCNHQLLQLDKSNKPNLSKHKKSDNQISEKIQLFDFSTETRESIKKNALLLNHVAKERIKEELCKSFQKWNPFAFIVLLDASGMLPILFPALAKTKFVDQPIRYHAFDVYTHIMLSLKTLQQINSDYLVRFAILYHDVWKVAQYAAYDNALSKEEKQAIFSWPLNHRESSPVLMRADFSALWFSKKEIDTIERYIREHHTPWEILNSHPNNRIKKVRKLFSEKWFDMVNNLFDINIADRIWQENPLQNSSDVSDSYYLKELLNQLNDAEWQFELKHLAVNWEKLMKHFQISPSPLVWELLHQAFEWVLTDINDRNNEKEIYVYLENYIKNRKKSDLNSSEN